MGSILTSVKKSLGLEPDYVVFDPDIIMHINSVLADLHQLGIGPEDGFEIEDSTPTWADFLGAVKPLNSTKSYVYLRVRLLFDPPQTSYLVTAIEEQIKKWEWRINTYREGEQWTDPNPEPTSL